MQKVFNKIQIHLQWFLLSLVAMVLCSCATQERSSVTQQPTFQGGWRTDGVFAYRDQHQGFTAGYVWKGKGDAYHIAIIGPLGAWRALLEGNANQAHLTTSDGKVDQHGQPLTLMQQCLGWSIPVNDLISWLWGKPSTQQRSIISKNSSGQITKIRQNDWLVSYSQFDNYQGKQLPNRIVLSQGDKKITVVIQHRSE